MIPTDQSAVQVINQGGKVVRMKKDVQVVYAQIKQNQQKRIVAKAWADRV